MPGAVRAAPGCDDASFDALEAGGTVEGLFLRFRVASTGRCFVWNFFYSARSLLGALSLVLFVLALARVFDALRRASAVAGDAASDARRCRVRVSLLLRWVALVCFQQEVPGRCDHR